MVIEGKLFISDSAQSPWGLIIYMHFEEARKEVFSTKGKKYLLYFYLRGFHLINNFLRSQKLRFLDFRADFQVCLLQAVPQVGRLIDS